MEGGGIKVEVRVDGEEERKWKHVFSWFCYTRRQRHSEWRVMGDDSVTVSAF